MHVLMLGCRIINLIVFLLAFYLGIAEGYLGILDLDISVADIRRIEAIARQIDSGNGVAVAATNIISVKNGRIGRSDVVPHL